MIKTQQQYKLARAKCQEEAEQLQKQLDGMKVRGYSEDEIRCLTGCTSRMLEQGCQAIDLYRRLKEKEASALRGLSLNRQLIGLRIYLGISQSKLASLLGIPRADLVRDEKNEYYNLTLERYGQILKALGINPIPSYVIGDWQTVDDVRQQFIKVSENQGGSLIIG